MKTFSVRIVCFQCQLHNISGWVKVGLYLQTWLYLGDSQSGQGYETEESSSRCEKE